MYGHVWSLRALWHLMSWLQRFEVIVLALMLATVVAIIIRVLHRYSQAQHSESTEATSGAFERERRSLVAELTIEARTLKSISVVAPYLGLAGTSIGLITGFRGIDIEAESGLAALIIAGVVPVAMVTSVVGLLVAIPAAWSHHYLLSRLDLLDGVSVRWSHSSRFAQTLPLQGRFSTVPFPLVAAPILAILAGLAFMEYASYKTPTGLYVSVVPARCEDWAVDRFIVLRVTDEGKLFINYTQEDWNSLPGVLAEIYGLRVHRTLYLLAEDGVSFQTVANVIDMVKNANVEAHQTVRTKADKLDITVRLITPQAMNACALEPATIGSSPHTSR